MQTQKDNFLSNFRKLWFKRIPLWCKCKKTNFLIKFQEALVQADSALMQMQKDNEELQKQIEQFQLQSGQIPQSQRSIFENELLAAVDKKIEEWKEILTKKDAEIEKLNKFQEKLQQQLAQFLIEADEQSVSALSRVSF